MNIPAEEFALDRAASRMAAITMDILSELPEEEQERRIRHLENSVGLIVANNLLKRIYQHWVGAVVNWRELLDIGQCDFCCGRWKTNTIDAPFKHTDRCTWVELEKLAKANNW